ncbi:unnamed protein product [Brassica oleracea var. botrytis]
MISKLLELIMLTWWCQLPCRLFYFNSQINKFSNNSLFMCF